MSTTQAGPVTGRRRARLAKSRRTRDRVLDTALGLFNERGTAAVSTNRIAAAAGLSPGNLYYHFAGKQEIIRALHDRYAAAYEQLWDADPAGQVNLARLRANLARGMDLAWQYRFLERELLALLRADPQLRASHRRVHERRLGQWVWFGEQLVAAGVLRPPRPPATLADLATAIWLIGTNWLPFLEITGDPQDPGQVAKGSDIVMTVLRSYLAGPQAAEQEEPEPFGVITVQTPAEPATTADAAELATAAREEWQRRIARIGSDIQLAFAVLWIIRGMLATGWPGRLPVALALAAAAIALAVWGTAATRGLAPRPRGPASRRLERGITIATVAQLAASCALPFILFICIYNPDQRQRSLRCSSCHGA